MGAVLELLWSSVTHVDWMQEPLTDFHEESKETAHTHYLPHTLPEQAVLIDRLIVLLR